MRVKDLIVESQQLDELTGKDIGRGVQKVAKGIGAIGGGLAGIPAAMKKGFAAGKTAVGGKPVAKPAATTPAATAPTTPAAAPTDAAADTPAADTPDAKPATGGALDTAKQAVNAFKQGFQKGSGKPEQEKPAAAPAAEPEAAVEKPAVDPKAVAQMQKDFAAQMQDLAKFKEDTMTNLSMLLRRISALEKATNTAQ